MASKKVLSIEIGSRLTRIAEVDYKVKNPKIYRTALLETPEGIMNDGLLKVTPEFAKELKAKILQSGMKSKQVIFTITSTKIASREIMIPKVKENRIAPLVAANASDYFPVDLSEYELAHLVLDTVRETVDTEKYKVMVLAVAKSMLESYEKLAKECGLTIAAIDYSGNSLYQIVKNDCGKGISMVVRIDEGSSMVTILEDGAMLMQRTVSYGVNDVVNCYINETNTNLSYEKALKGLKKTNYFELQQEGGEDAPSAEVIEKFAYALSDTVLGISRIYDYHNSRNVQKPITKVFLTGLGANIVGLSNFLGQRLGSEVSNLDFLNEYQIDKGIKKDQANVYISCLGAALAPLGFAEGRKEEQKSNEKKFVDKKPLVFCGACVAVAVGIFLAGVIPYAVQSGQKAKNAEKVESLSKVIPIYQEYIQTKNASNYLQAAYEYTVIPTENLVEFIEEMEDKMPKELYVTSFTANREGVSFSVVVNTKQQAADALLQLRTFESLKNINVDSISDTRGENSSGQVTFSVNADYVDGKQINQEETAMTMDEEIKSDIEDIQNMQ